MNKFNTKYSGDGSYDGCNWACIIPTIIEHSHTITKLQLYGDDENLPFTFVSSFTNLKELIFSFECGIYFEEFEKLENVNFSKLEILKIPYKRPKTEYIVNFLRNNGSNLKKFYVGEMNASLNLSIANHCPNIKSFLIRLDKEMAILRVIFNCCPYLESIIIWCGYDLNEKEVLDTIVNYSPNKFHELKMYIRSNICASPEDWESFFISWKYRTPKKLLNLVFLGNSIIDKEYLEIIEKYENLVFIHFILECCILNEDLLIKTGSSNCVHSTLYYTFLEILPTIYQSHKRYSDIYENKNYLNTKCKHIKHNVEI
uniref:F-box domain-containing protein n=1 Tax=Rhizophagus irregularis (strain DAOM 181602 / DAOM 197198 / MUCL 43194) TaxID=747089 RepID=U9SIN2_RHIID